MRAIGIIRVSRTAGREGESFASPRIQTERIATLCEREGLELVHIVEELDVSGGRALSKRKGLSEAIAAIENHRADVIAVAYFDRLVRSIVVQAEILERVEAAGGRVLAADVGEVSNGSTGQWLSASLHGLIAEHQRRTAAERAAEAVELAVARGVPPWPGAPPGYVRSSEGPLEPSTDAPMVATAFQMRADGATIAEIREFLRTAGIERSHGGVQKFLSSRIVLGELAHGKLVNPTAHPAIVDTDVWRKVQRARVPRGRKPSSDRLLARLGILRCAGCGARMTVGTSNGGAYAMYRCPQTSRCDRRASIGAEWVEKAVVDEVRRLLADVDGTADVQNEFQETKAALDRAQEALDAAFRAFSGFENEEAARERLNEFRAARDAAQRRVDDLDDALPALTVTVASWDRLTNDERRALIRASLRMVLVSRGRGPDRLHFEPK